MTAAEILAAIAVHRSAIDALEAMLRTTAPAAPVAPATARKPIADRRWELAARAFRKFPFESHTIRRICADHPEWAMKLRGGVWHVDADLFDELAARVARGEASFAVSTLSVKSVATDAQLALNYVEQFDDEEIEK